MRTLCITFSFCVCFFVFHAYSSDSTRSSSDKSLPEKSSLDRSFSEQCQNAFSQTPDKAEAICLKVLALDESEISRSDRTHAFLNLATIATLDGLYDKADRYLARAMSENPALQVENKIRYNWLRKKAFNYYKQDMFHDALPLMQDALRVAEYLELNSAKATSLNDLGATYMELGDFSPALKHFEQSLEILETKGRQDSIAITQSNIGIIYRELQQFDFATAYFSRALESMDKHLTQNPEDKISVRQIPQIYENRGIAYLKAKQYSQAGDDLFKSLSLYQSHQFVPEQVRVYSAIVELEIAQKDMTKAKQSLDKAQALQRQNNWQSLEYLVASTAYHKATGQYDEAIDSALAGKELANEKSRFEYQLSFLKTLGELYRLKSSYAQSMAYLDEYMTLYKSYLQQKYSPRVADLQSVIEVQQQRQEIQDLEFANQQSLSKIRQQQITIFLAVAIILLILTMSYVIYIKRKRESAFLKREINFHKMELTRLSQAEDDEHLDPTTQKENRCDSFDVLLVSLMRDCLDVWENVTGKTNIELAEESNIWTVVNDESRLRTRTMEKYLHIDKLPKSPRWRQVVRTCRYILINCELSNVQRDRLNDALESLLALQKQQALASKEARESNKT